MDDVVNLLTAVALLVTAVGTCASVMLGLRTKRAVSDVHTLVNNRSELQDARIDQLTKVIEKDGSTVPDRPIKD